MVFCIFMSKTRFAPHGRDQIDWVQVTLNRLKLYLIMDQGDGVKSVDVMLDDEYRIMLGLTS